MPESREVRRLLIRVRLVVIQNNVFNRSPLGTVLACALTTNLRRAKAPGNVLLDENEAGLPKQSVVVVSQVLTIDKQMSKSNEVFCLVQSPNAERTLPFRRASLAETR